MCNTGSELGWGLAERQADPVDAAAVMAGRVPLRGGVFILRPNPTWVPQSSLDSSGNNQQHALEWAMPLLREGMARGSAAMINRFYALLADWAHDNPPSHPVTHAAWEDFQVGYRLLTLACAVAGPKGGQSWLAGMLVTHIAQVSRSTGWTPINNASLLSSIGLMAAGCILHNSAASALALSRFAYLTPRLYRSDGSDNEGAPAYTLSNYRWQAAHSARMRACGLTPPAATLRTARMPDFVAAATRPDGRLENLGDSGNVTVNRAWVSGTAAEYAVSMGAAGQPPTSVFSRFSGGYVFGRTGWGTQRPFAEETFYSVRTGAGQPTVLHGHADQTALTLFAGGSPLLVDSGVYRYTTNAARSYVLSRRAHTSVTVSGLRSSAKAVTVKAAVSNADYDLVSLDDSSYSASRVRLQRDIFFSRAGGWLLVVDSVTSPVAVRVDQRWQLPRGRQVVLGPATMLTAGAGTNLAMRWLTFRPTLSVAAGQTSPSYSGWTSTAYGSLLSAPTVQASRSGTSVVLATFITPVAAGQSPPGAPGGATVGGRYASSTMSLTVTMPGHPPESVTLVHGSVLTHSTGP